MEAESNRQSNASRKRPRADTHRPEHVYPRKRAITACRLCRHRKVKCNNQRPVCGACADANGTCVYEDSEDHSVFDPASLKILERLEQVLSRLDSLQPSSLPAPSSADAPTFIEGNHLPVAPTQVAQAAPQRSQLIDGDDPYMPAARTNVESILAWPIFADYPSPNIMLDAIFQTENENVQGNASGEISRVKQAGFVEKDVARLVQRFIELVHVKNPVVDVETLWSYTHQVLEDGIDWSPTSCLVLLACALGSVAHHYTTADDHERAENSTSCITQADELASGQAYYNLARRRFGLLDKGILAPQCHFLACIFLMYTIQPVQAWLKLQQAAQSFHVYLVCQARSVSTELSQEGQSERRHLEQRIYWSCYKAECELRAEFDLPSGPLATSGYPDMHPSAPYFLFREVGSEEDSPEFAGSPPSVASRRVQTSRAHLEASWYYYLTEITLRRMENEVLRMFYQHHHNDWIDANIPSMVSAAVHMEQQLDLCFEQLPPALRQDSSDELSFMIWARIFECKCWLYRPFLYYAVHNPIHSMNWSLAQPLIDKALATCYRVISTAPAPHRHAGTIFAIRTSTANALCILAAAKCASLSARLQPDWPDQIQAWKKRMAYWRGECAGVTQAIDTVQQILDQHSRL